VESWWPAILVALIQDVSNARTKGFNRVIKQTKRGRLRVQITFNFQCRILSDIAVTRPQRSAA
jgi:transposase